jgi:hypothetical protein
MVLVGVGEVNAKGLLVVSAAIPKVMPPENGDGDGDGDEPEPKFLT